MIPSGTSVSSGGSRGRVAALLGMAWATATTALAHPGHPLADHGVGHVVTSPYHLALLAAVGLAAWIGGRWIALVGSRRIIRATGLAMVLVAGIVWGVGA